MATLVDENSVQLNQISEEWVGLELNGQQYIFDTDALYDLAIKASKALAELEQRQEDLEENSCLCSKGAH